MLWLFGQIWVWLVVAFALGAATSWLVLRVLDRPKAGKPVHEPAEPLDAERTQFIPAPVFVPGEPYEDDHYEDDDRHYDDDQEPDGHREGSLPLPPPRPAPAEDWPAEEEPAWPAEDAEAMRQWPGRSG